MTVNVKNLFCFVEVEVIGEEFASINAITTRPSSNKTQSRCLTPCGVIYLPAFLLFLPWLPCHFHLVVIEQQQHTGLS